MDFGTVCYLGKFHHFQHVLTGEGLLVCLQRVIRDIDPQQVTLEGEELVARIFGEAWNRNLLNSRIVFGMPEDAGTGIGLRLLPYAATGAYVDHKVWSWKP